MATKEKLTDEQIIAVMKQLKAGRAVAEMAREVGLRVPLRSLEARGPGRVEADADHRE